MSHTASNAGSKQRPIYGPLIVYGLVFLCLLAAFIAWQAATVRVFVVPENHVGVVERKGWFRTSREILPPGKHSEKKKSTFYALPAGEQRIDFQVRVVKGALQRPADYIKSWGFKQSNPLQKLANQVTVKPVLVRGSMQVVLDRPKIERLIKEAGSVEFGKALLPALQTSVRESFGERKDLPAFQAKLKTATARELETLFHVELKDVQVDEIKELAGEEAESWDLNLAPTQVLQPAPVSELVPELFWQAFWFFLIFIVVIGVLAIACPDIFFGFAAIFFFWAQ